MSPLLIVPSKPTPNGRLHLGHVAGPFLHADALGRAQRRAGRRVFVVGAVDVHDSHVLLAAHRAGVDGHALAAGYITGIREDLAAMGVALDAFVNPLDVVVDVALRHAAAKLSEELQATGRVVRRLESIPYLDSVPVTGAWLEGGCPVCTSTVSGFTCEGCGAAPRPDELASPHARHRPDATLSWRRTSCHHMRLSIPRAIEELEYRGVGSAGLNLARRELARTGGWVRLSIPARWGLPWGRGAMRLHPALVNGLVTAACARAVGLGDGQAVELVGSFGPDNALPYYLHQTVCADAVPSLLPFDRLRASGFLMLEGSKLSTSRRHGLWVEDAVDAGLSPELLRFHLSGLDLDVGDANLRLADLASEGRGAYALLRHRVRSALQELELGVAEPCQGSTLARLRDLLDVQAAHLEPGRVRLPAARAALLEWLAAHDEVCRGLSGSAWWLEGIALLAWPLLPTLARLVWRGLGLGHEPALSGLERRPRPRERTYLEPWSFEESALHACARLTAFEEKTHDIQ